MSSFKQKKRKVRATRAKTAKRLKKSGAIESSASYLKRTTLYPGNRDGRKRKREEVADGDHPLAKTKTTGTKAAGGTATKASGPPKTSEHIRVFPTAVARRAAVVKAYKAFRSKDGRQRRRVCILVATDKDARSLPKALGGKLEKKKIKSPKMAVGSGKQANWEWRGFRVFSSLTSKSERKAAAADIKTGKAYTVVLAAGEMVWRLQDVLSDGKTKLLLQEGPFPGASAYAARVGAIGAGVSRGYFLAPRRLAAGKSLAPAGGGGGGGGGMGGGAAAAPHPLAATGAVKDAKALVLRLESQGRKPTASHAAVCGEQ